MNQIVTATGLGALTTDKKIRKNLRPMNIQILFKDFTDLSVLHNYKWVIGLSDYQGNMVYNIHAAPLFSGRSIDSNGLIALNCLADPRGGTLSLAGLLFNTTGTSDAGDSSGKPPVLLQENCRYPAVTGGRILFEALTVYSSEKNTSNSASNSTTYGGKVGISGNIGPVGANAEGNASRTNNSGSSSVERSGDGQLLKVNLVWTAK